MRQTIKVEIGNIWDKWQAGFHIVIPTNIGWTTGQPDRLPNSSISHHAVMGAGLAKEASQRHVGLSSWYGEVCSRTGAQTPVIAFGETRLLLFPTKPLNPESPHLSWHGPATFTQIGKSVNSLIQWKQENYTKLAGLPIVLPFIGCGLGKQNPRVVYECLCDQIPSVYHGDFLIVDTRTVDLSDIPPALPPREGKAEAAGK